jgi:hypothetical protein
MIRLCGRESRKKAWTDLGYLVKEDVKEALLVERSFFAGETLRIRFRPTQFGHSDVFQHGIGYDRREPF